jgi:hypothetical protein
MGNELKPDAERAAWLADKIVALGDYAKEAAEMLRRWPSASDPVGEPVAVVVVHKDAPAEFFWTGNALTKGGKGGEVILPPGRHLLYASPLPQEPREAALTDERIFEIADSDEANPDNTGWGPKFNILPFARAIEREIRGAQEGKAGEDARDAARYRWLRDHAAESPLRPAAYGSAEFPDDRLKFAFPDLVSWTKYTGRIALDAAIDAAMSTTESADSRGEKG